MLTLFDATSHGCLHTCMPAQGSVTPLAVVYKRKHCFLRSVRPPRKPLRNFTRVSAVDEEKRTELSNQNKQQAGVRARPKNAHQSAHSLQRANRYSGAANNSKDAEKPKLKKSKSEGELLLLPNRRFFLAGLGSLTIGDEYSQPNSTFCVVAEPACHAAAVLVSNLGGATGFLLGLDGGQTANKLKIDSIFPVRGLKRCINYQQRFGEMAVLT